MTKTKDFFSNKRNIVIILIVTVAVVAVIALSIILNKPSQPVIVTQVTSSQTSSEETKPTIKVPDIVVQKPVSSETVSSKPNEIKVDGNPTSKPVEKPKSQPKKEAEKPKPPASSNQTQPTNNDGIDPKIQKILDDAGFSGTTNEGTVGIGTGSGGDDLGNGGYN